MRIQQTKKHSSKKILFAIALVTLLAAGGYFTWIAYTSKSKAEQTSSPQSTPEAFKEDRTYTTETENRAVTVPNNVDPSSIKNYKLITESETYKIRELDGEYYITLYAVINRPDQADMYRDQLRQYKQDALTYLRGHNINPDQVKIHYEPAEAATL